MREQLLLKSMTGQSMLRQSVTDVFVLFAVSGFAPELQMLAADPGERLFLVSGRDLLPTRS
jgi:hypothetical protein